MPLAASSTAAADDLRTAASPWTIWLGHSVAAGHIGDRGQVIDAPSPLVVDICGGGTL